MSWSTRELARLAGTTVNTVRHYHSLGLLEEPERRYNGYKEYRVHHLASLIRIRRLVELGMPLAQIADVDVATSDAVLELDDELRSGIERLKRARADLAAIVRADAPLDTPRGFEPIGAELSDADHSLIHISSRVLEADALDDVSSMIHRETADARAVFTELVEDADEMTRQRIAHGIAATGANWRGVTSHGQAGRVLADARRELYNDAQRDVIRRAATLRAAG
jgi:DNA-binding transcriptional MerR regulator